MTVKDLLNQELPVRVKLTEGFTLDESFDPGMIIQINSIVLEGEVDGCYKLFVIALASDLKYNKSVAIPNWRNPKTNNFEIDFFAANTNLQTTEGHYKDSIYVMDTDDFCIIVRDERKEFIRNQASCALELLKGHTPEHRENWDNATKTIEEFANYILELTNE